MGSEGLELRMEMMVVGRKEGCGSKFRLRPIFTCWVCHHHSSSLPTLANWIRRLPPLLPRHRAPTFLSPFPTAVVGPSSARLLPRHCALTFLHTQTTLPVFAKETITNSRHPTQTHTRRQPSHTNVTLRPTPMFAIASDHVTPRSSGRRYDDFGQYPTASSQVRSDTFI
jgi:hypothetical protein